MTSEYDGISQQRILEIGDKTGTFIHEALRRLGLTAAVDEHPADRLPPEVVQACIRRAIREENDTALINDLPLYPDHAGGVAGILAHLTGLGAIEPYLQYENWEDLWIVGPDCVFIRYGLPGRTGLQHEPGKFQLPVTFDSPEHLIRTLKAHLPAGAVWDTAHPCCDAMLPGAIRFHGSLKEVGREVYVTLRHHRSQVTLLPELVERGMLAPAMATFLDSAVKLGLTMLLIGGTGSGKTTLLNALLLCITGRHEHLLTIEQQAELRVAEPRFRHLVPHVTALWTRPGSPDGTGAITMTDLVRDALRMAPTRIIIGEIRGPEALDWLWAAKTGHKGSLASLHGESCADGLRLCRMYCQMAERSDLPEASLVELIASAVDLVLYLERDERDGSRRVAEIAEVDSYVPPVSGGGSGRVALNSLFVWDPASKGHHWTGTRPRCTDVLLRRGLPLGIDLTAVPAPNGATGEVAGRSR